MGVVTTFGTMWCRTCVLFMLALLPAADSSNCGDKVDKICVNNKGAYVMKFTLCGDNGCTDDSGSYDVGQTRCISAHSVPGIKIAGNVHAHIHVSAGRSMDCCGMILTGDPRNCKTPPFDDTCPCQHKWDCKSNDCGGDTNPPTCQHHNGDNFNSTTNVWPLNGTMPMDITASFDATGSTLFDHCKIV